jgi:hypothetical protein
MLLGGSTTCLSHLRLSAYWRGMTEEIRGKLELLNGRDIS